MSEGIGAWQDTTTGLTWEIKTDHNRDSEYTLKEGQAFANALCATKWGGYDDWRLPTLEELATLSIVPLFVYEGDYKRWRQWYEEHSHALINNYFIHPALSEDMGVHGWYWSVTPHSNGEYLLINFKDGNTNTHVESQSYYIRCVRGVMCQP